MTDREKEAFIGGIEFARDWNLDIPPDDLRLYERLIQERTEGEFAEKYLKQGTKIVATGRIQTGSYTNRDGQKVYTTDFVIEEQEFAESKKVAGEQAENAGYSDAGDGFMNIPDGVDGELPFM